MVTSGHMWSHWVTYLESMAFGDHVDPFSGQIVHPQSRWNSLDETKTDNYYTCSASPQVTILHPCPRDTGKVAALGPNIMSPKGCKLLPEGRRAAGSRPEGDNLWPEGHIMFGPWVATFPVAQGKGCRISNIIMVGPLLHNLLVSS